MLKCTRGFSMGRRLARAGALGFLIFGPGLPGCENQSSAPGGGDYSAPAPRHPAMTAPASAGGLRGGEGAKGGGGEAELPPGHPPIGGALAATPGGAGEPARGGASLLENLAEFGLALELPSGWIEATPASSAPGGIRRLGTIRLPKVEGDAEDGEISVIPAFGSEAANIERWRGQFQEKPEPNLNRREVSGIAVTLVEMDGTFSTGGGPMAASAGAPKPNTKLLGAIVNVPGAQNLIFFKAWGPRATMEKWKPSFEELVSSIKPAR